MFLQYLLGILIFLTSFLNASCFTLGKDKNSLSEVIKVKNTILWQYKHNRWSVSLLEGETNFQNIACKDNDYLLVNNNKISYKTSSYKSSTYELKRGWNYLSSPENGIDIEKTFKNAKGVEFVYVYEGVSQVWAGYSPLKANQEKMNNTRILSLKKIEPNIGFYVYARENLNVKIKSAKQKNLCKTFLANGNYESLIDSGTDAHMIYNEDKTMGIKSRYLSHYRRGVYDDSRLMLLYKKLKTKAKVGLKYGPAVPKSMIQFSKEYEGANFYIYDFKDEKCYEGIFPSMKIPPFASLKKLN